jgi:hypothetical protein
MTLNDLLENFELIDNNFYWKKPRSGIAVGQKAGCLDNTGYIRIRFNQKKYLLHRLLYLYHHGFMPKYVDHIDGNPLNNDIKNLRKVTFSQNRQNLKKQKNNTSGYKNVVWSISQKKWRVTLWANGKFMSFGGYDDIELAGLVAQEARNKYHGEFARHD